MVDEAVYTGLKNSLERGEGFESAIRIMIDSGYDRFEINEAAKQLTKEFSDSEVVDKKENFINPIDNEDQDKKIERNKSRSSGRIEDLQLHPTTKISIKKKKSYKKVIMFGIIIILLIAAAGLSYLLITKFI
ncbi:MAG: hypothetical protein V1660_03420 [archaeon]